MSRNITDVSAPTTISCGVRTNCLSVRAATAPTVVRPEGAPAGRRTLGATADRGTVGATAVVLVAGAVMVTAGCSMTVMTVSSAGRGGGRSRSGGDAVVGGR